METNIFQRKKRERGQTKRFCRILSNYYDMNATLALLWIRGHAWAAGDKKILTIPTFFQNYLLHILKYSFFLKISNFWKEWHDLSLYKLKEITRKNTTFWFLLKMSTWFLYSRVRNSSTSTFISFWEFFPPILSYSSQYVY